MSLGKHWAKEEKQEEDEGSSSSFAFDFLQLIPRDVVNYHKKTTAAFTFRACCFFCADRIVLRVLLPKSVNKVAIPVPGALPYHSGIPQCLVTSLTCFPAS